jgi:hypothetical protein
MNNQQLEIAAREYCRLAGIDPDELVVYDNGTMAFTRRARWRNVAVDVVEHFNMRAAIEKALKTN